MQRCNILLSVTFCLCRCTHCTQAASVLLCCWYYFTVQLHKHQYFLSEKSIPPFLSRSQVNLRPEVWPARNPVWLRLSMVTHSYQAAVNLLIWLNPIVVFPLNVLQTDSNGNRERCGSGSNGGCDSWKKKVKMKQNEVKVEKNWGRVEATDRGCLNKTKGNVLCESVFLPPKG